MTPRRDELSWIEFEDALGRTYDYRGNPTNDWTWDRPWWRRLFLLPAKAPD